MYRIFIALGVFISWLSAAPLHVNHSFEHVSTYEHQLTVEDSDHTLTPQKVLQEVTASNYLKKAVSYTKSWFWTKVEVKNIASTPMPVVFQNIRATTGKIDVYIYHQGALINQYKLGMLRLAGERTMHATKSAFYLRLKPHESYTIVTRQESFGAMNMGWDIYSTNAYTLKNSFEMLFWGVFGGVIFALVIYNLSMLVSLKEWMFLFYILHALSAWWLVYALDGMFYFMDGGATGFFVTLSTWFVPPLMLFWLCWFTISFFDLRDQTSTVFRLLAGLSVVCLGLFAILFSQLFWQGLLIYTHLFVMIALGIFLCLFGVMLYLFAKDYRGSGYFLIGEGSYLAALLVLGYYRTSAAGLDEVVAFALPVGLLCEIIMLSMALSGKIKRMRTQNIQNEFLLMEEAKFASIGKNVAEVVHQWKEPIGALASHMTYWDGLITFGNKKRLAEEIEKDIPVMQERLSYLNNSLNELYHFFRNNDAAAKVVLAKQIALALKIQRDRLVLAKVEVEVRCDGQMSIVTNPHALANVMMILLDNSIDAFLEHQDIEKRNISIVATKTDEGCKIQYADNAGGIKVAPITRVFEPQFTTKKEGMGLGLALAKKLIEKRMGGALHVTNKNKSTQFTIHLHCSKCDKF